MKFVISYSIVPYFLFLSNFLYDQLYTLDPEYLSEIARLQNISICFRSDRPFLSVDDRFPCLTQIIYLLCHLNFLPDQTLIVCLH